MKYVKLKQKLYEHCVEIISTKLNTINALMNDAQESANSETKSTAGDKHDTARAMAHLETEKNASQLAEINKLKKVLPYLENHKAGKTIDLGSLVITDSGNYYISISLGKVEIENMSFFAISAMTPIGKLLIGKKVGEAVDFNGKKITISAFV